MRAPELTTSSIPGDAWWQPFENLAESSPTSPTSEQPRRTYPPELITKAAEALHLGHVTDPHFTPTVLHTCLKIAHSGVARISDDLWESIKFAPQMAGINSHTSEDKLTDDQQEALALIADYIKAREDKALRFQYSMEALSNPSQDPSNLPAFVNTISKIVTDCLENSRNNELTEVVSTRRYHVFRGLRRTIQSFGEEHRAEKERFQRLLVENGSFSGELICDIFE